MINPSASKAMPGLSPKKRAQAAIAVLLAVSLGLWACGVWLIRKFEETAPHAPDASTGHIYAFRDKGNLVYLTSGQHWIVNASFAVLPLLTPGILVIVGRARREAGRSSWR